MTVSNEGIQTSDEFPERTTAAPAPGSTLDESTRSSLALRLAVGDVSSPLRFLAWLLVACLLLIGVGQCFTPVTAQDEGELLVYPWLIAQGHLPYRDIWMMYPPSTYLILAGLVKAGIPGLVADRAISFIVRVLCAVLVNRMLTGSWTRLSIVGTPLILTLLFYGSNMELRAYPWVIGMPLVFLGLRAVKGRPYLAAALFWLAGTFRYEFAAAGLVALGALTILSYPNRARFFVELRAALILLASTVLFCLGMGAVTGGAAIQETIIQPLLFISPGRRLPLWPPYFGWWEVPLELIILLGPPTLIAVGMKVKNSSIVATNLSCMVLDMHFLQRADGGYLLWVGALVGPWLLISLVDLARPRYRGWPAPILDTAPGKRRRESRIVTRSIGAIGIAATGWNTALTLLFAMALSPLSPMSPCSIWQGGKLLVGHGSHFIIEANSTTASADRSLLSYLDHRATPSDTVFVAPRALRYAIWNMTSLYYVLGPEPASRYLEMNPGVETQASIQRQIISDLRHCRWIVLTRAGYWYEPNASHIPGSSLLQHFIRRHYRIVFSNAQFQLLRFVPPGVGGSISGLNGKA